MATDSLTFEWTSAALEASTPFDRLQARGTVRLALRQAGLDATTVTPDDMAVVIQKILPKELTSRKVADAERVCRELVLGLRTAHLQQAAPAGRAPEDAFRRMFGGAPQITR